MEDLIVKCDLIDVKPNKGKFTWSNKRSGCGNITAQLDCFLIHSSWILQGLDSSSSILVKSESDHCLISLKFVKKEDLGAIPFKYNPKWLKEDRFLDIIKMTRLTLVQGSPTFVWEVKLRAVKQALQICTKEVYVPPSNKKDELVKDLEKHLDNMENSEVEQ